MYYTMPAAHSQLNYRLPNYSAVAQRIHSWLKLKVS